MGEKMGRNPPWRELRPGLSSSARSTPCAPASSLEAPAATQPPCTYLKYHHDHYPRSSSPASSIISPSPSFWCISFSGDKRVPSLTSIIKLMGSHIFLCSGRLKILVTGLLVWRLPPLAVDLRLPMCHDHNWYHFDHYCNNDDDTCAKAKGWNLSVKNGFDGWSWCWRLWRRRIFIEGDFNLPRGLPPLLCVGPGVSILFLVETTSFCVNTDDSHNNEEQHGHNFEDPGISVPSSNYHHSWWWREIWVEFWNTVMQMVVI